MRILVVVGVALAGAALLLLCVRPFPQDLAYHAFADRRPFLGLANFLNVVSNLPLVLVGLLGLWRLHKGPMPGALPDLVPGYRLFFLGMCLIGLGSAYYHLSPSNETLFWDRLAMAIAFMAFLALVAGETLSPVAGRRLLWPLVVLGVAAVWYWRHTELAGAGDLRLYVLVQFLPLVLVPLMLLLFPGRLSGKVYLWSVMAAYVAAKAAELADAALLALPLGLSGHSLKHLLAALAAWLFLRALAMRRPLGG